MCITFFNRFSIFQVISISFQQNFLKLVCFFTHIVTNNSSGRVYHRVIGLLDPLVFSGEGSAAFSVKAERKQACEQAVCQKEAEG
ncbi:hypothetical protein BAXH7_03943 [Bacillus amyloliquefaciens XH7]|nr:hypothetical protein BAXH7_03943 [Bacillus amyloliquefaciens XH7]